MLFAALVAAPLAPARAQERAPALQPAIAATPLMTRVRVELRDRRRVIGTLREVGTDAFTIAVDSASALSLRYDDASRFWRRGRATKTGAIVGGIAGGLTGAFFGVLAHGLCEYNCGGSFTGSAAIGAVIVGGIGAGAGAIIGAALPRWNERWRGAPATAAAPGAGIMAAEARPVRPRRIGEVTLLALAGGGGYPADPAAAGTRGFMGGVSASLGFRAGRFAFGPDAMVLQGAQPVRALAGTMRLDLGAPDAPRATYLIAGMGGYSWPVMGGRHTLLTAIAGVGVTSHAGWRAEARWHPTVQNLGSPVPGMVTLAVGRRIVW
jgi:hypothetical protein